jgi:Domain of unknown function DUF302
LLPTEPACYFLDSEKAVTVVQQRTVLTLWRSSELPDFSRRPTTRAYVCSNSAKCSLLQRLDGVGISGARADRNALQYDIGNPLTASKMTRHQLPAALYAPLRVVLFEDEQGRGIFEYDKPSSYFGQYGDERVTEVGRYLDATLEAVLRNAAE